MIMYIESEESKSNQENQDETEKNEVISYNNILIYIVQQK